jgi:hypothetical protein
MDKTQLVARASKRGLERYGQGFSESLFDDLLDDGLIKKGERRGNDGKRPIYEFGYVSYRRTLQILRLRSKGIVGRDATKVQLFLCSYSLPVWDVREALSREYTAAAKAISVQVRSSYADNWKTIPPKHKMSLVRQTGVLDLRFESAGLRLSADQLIEILRIAKQKPVDALSNAAQNEVSQWLLGNPSFQHLTPALLRVMSGMLMFDPEADLTAKQPDDIRKLITSATDDAFVRARRLYGLLVHSGLRVFWTFIKTDSAAKDRLAATGAALSAIREQSEFAASALVECLRLANEISGLTDLLSSDENCSKAMNMLNSFSETPPKDSRK